MYLNFFFTVIPKKYVYCKYIYLCIYIFVINETPVKKRTLPFCFGSERGTQSSTETVWGRRLKRPGD